MSRRVTITLTEAQYGVLLSVLGWVDAAGDESECAEAQSTRDRTTYYRMVEAVRNAGSRREAK